MLNRLYIIIGSLAILLLAAGFIVPQFIDWGAYRQRLEQLAETNLGTDITIDGEIDFQLLPQPVMKFGKTKVGPPDSPFIEIESMEAEFSLMDFLRDKFTVTRLEVDRPTVHLILDDAGRFILPFNLPDKFSANNVSVARAQITGGRAELRDSRTDQTYEASNFAGDLRISGVTGPFSLQGRANYDGDPYSVGVTLTSVNEQSQSSLSATISPVNSAFLMSIEGLATLGASPSLDGKLGLRIKRKPADAEEELGAAGDLVMLTDMTMSPEKISMPTIVLQPDENRPATRLTGAVTVTLGAEPSFDAVFSGGVFGVAPSNVLAGADEPYPLVDLLAGLPPPVILPIPGRLGVDISELDLDVFAMRNVRIDARANDNGWQVDDFTGQLAGDTQVALSGEFDNVDGAPAFNGALDLTARRLDSLSRLWGASGDPILFDVPTHVAASVTFGDGALGLANGRLGLDGSQHTFAGLFKVTGDRNALLSVRLGDLDAAGSKVLGALMPPLGAGSDIWRSFPTGSIDLAAENAYLFGLSGAGLATQIDWSAGQLNIRKLSARDWGGAKIDFSGTAKGTILDPDLTGTGFVSFADAQHTDLMELALEAVGAQMGVRDAALGSLPLDATFDIGATDQNGAQKISVRGRAGVADLAAEADLSKGLTATFTAPLQLAVSLSSAEPDAFAQQFGLDFTPLAIDARTNVDFSLSGTASNSFDLTLAAEGGDDHIGYGGSLVVTNPEGWRGSGRLDFALGDASAALELLGVSGPYLGAVGGTGQVVFAGTDSIALNDLSILDADGRSLAAGQFNLSSTAGRRLVAGQVALADANLDDVWASIFGPAAMLPGEGIYPEGPIDLGSDRASRAVVDFSVDRLSRGGEVVARNLSGSLAIDDDKTSLRNVSAEVGGGTFDATLSLCCANQVTDKQLDIRGELSGISLDSIAPEASAALIDATLSGSFSVSGTGGTIADLVGNMNGSGSFSAKDVSFANLNPAAFTALDSAENLADTAPDDLVGIVTDVLNSGPFMAGEMDGAFRVLGGKVSADNLGADSGDATIFGDLTIDLTDGTLGGDWALSPKSVSDANPYLTLNDARITSRLTGTLDAPDRELDVAQMVDAMQVRALEVEVQRLEELRAQQEEARRLAAEEQARQDALEAERQAELARQQAEQEAAQQAARDAEQQAAQQRQDDLLDQARQILNNNNQQLNFNIDSQDPLLQPDPPVNLIGQ
ncbi:MAG: AsmA family protein [Hyphomicrobiaceae bacterium]|nr:AsmA family protein [Hyphomicrobiaceae bacterium]MCC0024858.1 AsmA family protein [Hyphomicrobiaceae bacterium]